MRWRFALILLIDSKIIVRSGTKSTDCKQISQEICTEPTPKIFKLETLAIRTDPEPPHGLYELKNERLPLYDQRHLSQLSMQKISHDSRRMQWDSLCCAALPILNSVVDGAEFWAAICPNIVEGHQAVLEWKVAMRQESWHQQQLN